ncbi:MAG: hypothetical protein QF747_00155 [Patescibacteria group bacterium]|jgi:hypothetical protein|nr:hypothetical protein [Patescibacteria group bacterium]MDP6756350.1 hypothetical protein [Patescibacteria group bacterium]|tara:strand:+ start:37508 stop:38122 length:615 start_codon:yes stop_codon:yes gene_type:complete
MYLLQAATTTNLDEIATTTSAYPQLGDAFASINTAISGFNFQNPTWDLFIILFFVVSAFVYGLTLGRDRIILILIAVYMSLAIIGAAPFVDELVIADFGENNAFVSNIIIFLITFVALFFLLSRSALLRALARSDAPGAWWQIIVFSLLHVGLLISITLSFIPEEHYGQLSSFTRDWFVGAQAEFFWVIAPIAALALVSGEKDK